MKTSSKAPFGPRNPVSDAIAPGSSLPSARRVTRPNGFALIITISMMILLSLLAVGMLSLSGIALRSSTSGLARAEAQANARLAMQLALAELQKSAGDDRRITADGSIFEDAKQPGAVGVWESWSPGLTRNSRGGAPDYDGEKNSRFVKWLVSGDSEELSSPDWAKSATSQDSSQELFRQESDGFSLKAPSVMLGGEDPEGSMAWAITQENTKAKITVGGPEQDQRVANDDLQAQPRPSLANSTFFGEPSSGWNERAARVIGFNQAKLDEDLWAGPQTVEGKAHFTTVGAGLLTNVVDGGLKTDMSLGFEMAENDFESASWASEGETFNNPFHGGSEDGFDIPGSYANQRPLFEPLSSEGTYDKKQSFWPANVQYHFPITSIPTFQSLRSFYRMPYHLYESDGELTVFERENDHIAGKPGGVDRGYFAPPPASVDGEETKLGVRPVMDRVMFLISGGLADNDELRLVITPLITLWNPYNVALEIEGSVAHVWIDIPYDFSWRTFNASGRQISNETMYTSGLMGHQFLAQNHGRSVDPYFFAAITANGEPLSSSGKVDPIRFEPGEVRVFAPSEQRLKEFNVTGSIRERTLFLRPVEDLGQFTTRGGFSVPTRNPVRNQGFTRKLLKDQAAQISFASIPGEDYPFYISLEDATRAKGNNPGREDRGKAIADILANNFSRSGETITLKSPRVPYARLKNEPVPIGVLESYHRVARSGGDAQVSDVVFTGNPRQPWMNPFITETKFKTGPQYQSRMRAVSSFNGVLQSSNNGRSAFYGASQTPNGGRTHLSFFEIPSAPLLSLAAFQHGDFSSTPFAPANQFANSWASAYVPREKVSDGELAIDHCYLLNEALWDGWFFSGAAPTIDHTSLGGSSQIWDSNAARITRPLDTVLTEFFEDPQEHPLRNPRMQPADLTSDPADLVRSLLRPEGCMKIAADLMVDGAFNVNSTSVEAWTAMLKGLRGASFELNGTTTSADESTPFPRFRDPVGTANDKWHGFRSLDDSEIDGLAEQLVEEIRQRGPFLSLGEFVNRRVASDELGLKGALQAAIDNAGINQSALEDSFSTENYERSSRNNITPSDTGVGIPGYLTQADVLKPLASVITVRSDTFTIRSYGDSRDASGKVVAQAWAEATIQRIPEFVDPSDEAFTSVDNLNDVNETFGRRFRMISFRYLPESEVRS